MTHAFETLSVRQTGAIVEIVLDRAEQRNAINHAMHAELAQAFRDVGRHPDVRAIVLAANGRFFSAGGDFGLMLADRQHPERRPQMMQAGRDLFEAACLCPLPIVVALQGDAIGLGATLALAGDAIVAARGAHISDPHVVIGLVAGDGGCVLWPNAMGLVRAKRYLLTGDRLAAADAHAMGLITDLVDTPEAVLDQAREIAGRIAALPPLAVQRTKRALNAGVEARMREVFELALEGEMDTFFSDDVGEAISAFREKRQGVFTGT